MHHSRAFRAPVRSAVLALALAGSSIGLTGIAPAQAGTTATPSAVVTSPPATTTTEAADPAGETGGTATDPTTSTAGSTVTSTAPGTASTTTRPATTSGPVKVAGDTSVTVAAAPTGTPAQRAAAYLVASLADGDHVVGPYGTDLGQTADVVLGLSAAQTQTTARDAAAAYLAAHLGDYVHGAAYVDGTSAGEKAGAHYAGPTGKAILAALAAGQDPTTFGGFDLVTELQALMATSGTNTGRFQDDSAYGDYSNPVGQAFDILALERATPAGAPAAAVTFLLRAQCKDGGFADAWPASAKACTSTPDATGLALQALIATGSDCAATQALGWLRGHVGKDGSFASAATSPGKPATANVNSTAYAALGLTAAQQSTAAQVAYLTKAQNADGGLPVVPSAKVRTSDLLATAQAVAALSKASMLSIGTNPIAARTPVCPTTTTTATSGTGGTVSGGASTLPRTGGTPFGALLTGLMLLAIGTGALLFTRRPRALAARHR